MTIKQFFPLLRLYFIFIKYSLDELFYEKFQLSYLKIFCWLNPYYLIRNRKLPRAMRLRLALQDAGPIFIKFGQLFSTRYDALPEDILLELAQLRDQVSPVSGKKIIQHIEKTFEKKITELFQHFSTEPLASASIAQVHRAKLNDGSTVVVKALRPNIKKQIYRDIILLESGAKFLEKRVKRARKLKPTHLVNEIKTTLLNELSLQNEASNASKLKKNSLTIDQSYIPNIYWDYCSDSILVMQEISGISIQETSKLIDYQVNLSQLAHTCINVFFTQIFRDRFFHADLHPGNIFVDVKHPEKPIIELVDFGITGTLSLKDQRYIAENMLAIINKDYLRVAQLHQDSAWIPSSVPLEAFARAIEKVCAPILNKPLKEISFGELLRGLIEVAKQYHINIQPQLLLLQKTLINIEGLCRRLDPNINIWQTAKPIIERWLKQQLGPSAFFKKLKQQLPLILQKAPDFPEVLCQVLNNMEAQADKANQPPKNEALDNSSTHGSPNNNTLLKAMFMLVFLFLLFQNNFNLAPIWLNNLLLTLGILAVILI